MPKCCGVESEVRKVSSGGRTGYTYYCPVCKSMWLPAAGLEFLSEGSKKKGVE